MQYVDAPEYTEGKKRENKRRQKETLHIMGSLALLPSRSWPYRFLFRSQSSPYFGAKSPSETELRLRGPG